MKERGITLTILVITIIVISIIASTTVYVGIGTIASNQVKRFESEMQIIQNKCNELIKLGWGQEDFLKNETKVEELGDYSKVEKIKNSIQNVTGQNNIGNYIYYNNEGLERLGIIDINREIVINIPEKIIIDINGVKDSKNNTIYTIEWTGYSANKNTNRIWKNRF